MIGTDSGVVKKVGIKTTRLQTLQGEELIVANKELTEARIKNYKKMEKRRIVFPLGVTYETPVSKLKKIPKIIKAIIKEEEKADYSRAHFKDFGDFSLNYEIVYLVMAPDYDVYMNVQQSINLSIKKAFEEEGIEFAYPTQVIYSSQINQE